MNEDDKRFIEAVKRVDVAMSKSSRVKSTVLKNCDKNLSSMLAKVFKQIDEMRNK